MKHDDTGMRVGVAMKAAGNADGLRVKTRIQAGRIWLNHNAAGGLRVKTRIRAGRIWTNHNVAGGLRVKTRIRAGGCS